MASIIQLIRQTWKHTVSPVGKLLPNIELSNEYSLGWATRLM